MTHADLLLVIDVQNGFVNERSEHVVDPIAGFVGAWIDAGREVVLTRFVNDPGSQWEKLIHWTRLRQSPEIDLHPRIASTVAGSKHAHVLDKRTYSSLTPEFKKLLKKRKPARVLICGIATDGCVLKTAVDLFEDGETPIVLADLCSSHAGETVHDAGLLLIGRFIGKDQVVSSSSVAP